MDENISVSPLQWVQRIDATTTQSLCARPTTAACLSGPSAMARTTAGTTVMSRAAVSLLLFRVDQRFKSIHCHVLSKFLCARKLLPPCSH